MITSSPVLPQGFILNHSYRIINLIGQGGFGRSYLVELIATGEQRILKEFAPQVSRSEHLVKAKELFNREVGTLQKLSHPQIPQFFELLQEHFQGEDRLFFVQEYIKGKSYDGQKLTVNEVIKFLQEILPVLSYLHQQNVIHRDISPDNIIHRAGDGKPVLIDFGAVKVASTQVYQNFFGGANLTKIGKTGYVPPEQILRGVAFPSSDLYALGVTAIALLTGENPSNLHTIDPHHGIRWHWETKINLDRQLAEIINQMIAENHFHRFQKADEVLGKLNHYLTQKNQVSHPHTPLTKVTVIASLNRGNTINYQELITNQIKNLITYFAQFLPKKNTNIPLTIISNPVNKKYSNFTIQKLLIIISLIVGPGFITFMMGSDLIKNKPIRPKTEICPKQDENKRKQCIQEKASKLYNKNTGIFYQEVDQIFYQRNPELKGRKLTNSQTPQEVKLRNQWYEIAENLLVEKS